MDNNKYTTITVTKELSKKIRLLAIHKNMRTSEFLEYLINQIKKKDLDVLMEEVDADLYELGIKKKK
jgi:hypothetical protein